MPPRVNDIEVKSFLAELENFHKMETDRPDAQQALNRYNNFAYKWAMINERNRHYQPLNFSGDSAAYSSNDLLTRRVRDQVRNDPIVKSIPIKLADRVVGTGLRTFSDPIEGAILSDDEKLLLEQLEQAHEMDTEHQAWYEDKDAFDVEGKMSGPEMEAAGFREQVTSGDTILLRCFRKRLNVDMPLCYQLIERDQLDRRRDHPSDDRGIRCVNGIELDKSNRPVAYWIYDAHPGDSFQPFQSTLHSTKYPAERVIHLFAFARPSQNVGVSWLDAIGQDLFDEDRMVSSELQVATKNAVLAFYANRKNPYSGGMGIGYGDEDYGGVPCAGNGNDIALGSSPLAIELGLDEKLGIVESTTRPNIRIMEWLQHAALRKSAGVGLSVYSLMGDYSRTNYTGFRGAMIDEDISLKPLQGWYGHGLCLPIRREFNALAVAIGRYQRIKPSEFQKDLRRFQRFDLVTAGRQFLEPEKETDATMAALRSGLMTFKVGCAKLGFHWVTQLRQIARENLIKKMLGVTLDYSKGQGGQIVAADKEDDSVFQEKQPEAD
jgi:lambda family phage portal protein